MGRIRHDEIEVPAGDPFKNDLLGRDEIEPVLTSFALNLEGSCVLALNGPWGCGKTTFIRMWGEKLREVGCPVFYFNAWQNDYVEDPLIPLISSLTGSDEEVPPGAQLKMEKIRQIANGIGRRALPAAVKALTYGALDLSDSVEAAIGDGLAGIAEDQLASYESSKKMLLELRSCLEELVVSLSNETSKQQDDSEEDLRPLVLFIDELDRCRPSFAVNLLERVKHALDVDGILFVLGIDRQQLAHSVTGFYGSSFDGDRYLNRFIDIDFHLPSSAKTDAYALAALERMDIKNLPISERWESEVQRLGKMLAFLARFAELEPRAVNQVVARLFVILERIPANRWPYEESLAVLLFIRTWKPQLYDQLRTGGITPDDALDELETIWSSHPKFRKDRISDLFMPAGWVERVMIKWQREIGLPSRRQNEYELRRSAKKIDNRESGPSVNWEEWVLRMLDSERDLQAGGVGYRKAFARIELSVQIEGIQ